MMDSSETPSWQLRPLQLPNLPETISLDESAITFGRDPANTIVLSEVDFPHVSGNHARVVLRAGEPIVEDLESKNGTLVNGKKVGRRVLKHGDVVMLGEMGPRFAVLSLKDEDVAVTAIAEPAFDRGIESARKLSATTIIRVKKALGIPEEAHLSEMLEARSRQQHLMLGVAVLVIVGVLIVAVLYLGARSREERERELARFDRQQRSTEARLSEQMRVWESEKLRLEVERDGLLARIDHLESEGKSSAGNLDDVRKRLEETQGKLDLYNPVDFEKKKLEKVARVGESVVLLERQVFYRETASQKLLYIGEDDEPNLNDQGSPFIREGTGSGFCVSPEGHIITNAHVVSPPDQALPVSYEETTLEPVTRISVVFSGSSTRHPAQVEAAVLDGDLDLALVKIEAFAGMPSLETLNAEIEMPPGGSEVFLYGFPLGTHAVQAGETVIASTFKGILSRMVGPFMQVDAGVYPGNSGGPITDGDGNVIGIVTAVQRYRGSTAARIGYALPISVVRRVWPPVSSESVKSSPKKSVFILPNGAAREKG